jgi:hypothetical protein
MTPAATTITASTPTQNGRTHQGGRAGRAGPATGPTGAGVTGPATGPTGAGVTGPATGPAGAGGMVGAAGLGGISQGGPPADVTRVFGGWLPFVAIDPPVDDENPPARPEGDPNDKPGEPGAEWRSRPARIGEHAEYRGSGYA